MYDGEGHHVKQQVSGSDGTTTSTTYVGDLEEVTSVSHNGTAGN